MNANIVDFFSYSFVQNAFLVAIIIGITLPFLSIVLYLRKMIFLSDTIGQVSMVGASFNVLISSLFSNLIFDDTIMVVLWTILGAIFIQYLNDKLKHYQDVSLMITHALAISLVMIFLSISKNYSSTLFSILFGNINTITASNVILILVSSILIVSLLVICWKPIVLSSLDQENATLYGINVKFYNYLIIILASLMIALVVKVIGTLLVAAMITIPIISANNVSRNLKEVLFFGITFTTLSMCGGLLVGLYINLPTSAMIVCVSLIIFVITIMYKLFKEKNGKKK